MGLAGLRCGRPIKSAPMPKPGHRESQPSNEIARFIDRDDQRAIFRRLLDSATEPPVLMFYGVGGGVDLNMSKHVGVRFAADFVHYKLFSDLLATGQNGVRLSVAPIFRLGGSLK